MKKVRSSLLPLRRNPILPLLVILCFLLGSTYAWAFQTGENRKSWLGVDVFRMIGDAEALGQVCLVILALFSVSSWAVMIYKFLHLRQAMIQTEEFVSICNHGSGQLDEAFKAAADYPDSPLAQILREGYLELEIENWYRDGYNLEPAARIDMAKIGIERVFDRTITNEISHLERKLIYLATTTSVCPFVGLFGTVWGIMVSFQSLGSEGAISIASIAPGLSTALLTTVGGLFCAIPASLMYNNLTNTVRILTSQMDSFALELSNIVQKQILKQSVQ